MNSLIAIKIKVEVNSVVSEPAESKVAMIKLKFWLILCSCIRILFSSLLQCQKNWPGCSKAG